MAWLAFLAAALLFGATSAHAQIRHQQEGCAWGQGLLAVLALGGAFALAVAQVRAGQ